MSDPEKVMQMIKENDVKYVDLRFTDPRGKWQHLAHAVETINEDTFTDGIMFDGSSIAGWKAINESDMTLIPDASTAVMDPFAAQPSLVLFCDVYEPGTGQPYGRDPRSIAKKAENYLKSTGIGDTAFFGPEIEFFVFDDVRFKSSMNMQYYEVDSEEGPYVTDKKYEDGNMGHRPPIKGGYFPVPPVDSASDLRAEMLTVMKDMGLKIEKHHHEVAPSQHELGNVFSTLVSAADGCQIYKYVVHNVAISTARRRPSCPSPSRAITAQACTCTSRSGRTASLPSPATSMPTCRKTACSTSAALSSTPRLINAFTNPLTNSYKRLIPGFEAPVLLAYSARNRSRPACLRIPYVASPKRQARRGPLPGSRLEPVSRLRGDAGWRAWMASRTRSIPATRWTRTCTIFAALHRLGKKVPQVCGGRCAKPSTTLEKDHDFLLQGDVFDHRLRDRKLHGELKWEEIYNFAEHTPHPIESTRCTAWSDRGLIGQRNPRQATGGGFLFSGAEEFVQFFVGVVGRFFGQIVATIDRPPPHVIGPVAPHREHVVPGVELAPPAPECEHGTGNLAPAEILGVVHAIDRGASADSIHADAVDRLCVAEAAQIILDRLGGEEFRRLGAARCVAARKSQSGIGADQAFPGRSAGWARKNRVVIAKRKIGVGALKGGQGRHDVEHRQLAHPIGMIQRHAIGDPTTAIVTGDGELPVAEMLHHRDLVGGHGALGIRAMIGRSGRLTTVAVAAQIGRDNREILGQPRRHLVPHDMRLRTLPWSSRSGGPDPAVAGTRMTVPPTFTICRVNPWNMKVRLSLRGNTTARPDQLHPKKGGFQAGGNSWTMF